MSDCVNKFKLPNSDDEQTVLKTIRLRLTLLKKVELLSKEKNLSVNRILNECIEFALNNLEDSGNK